MYVTLTFKQTKKIKEQNDIEKISNKKNKLYIIIKAQKKNEEDKTLDIQHKLK